MNRLKMNFSPLDQARIVISSTYMMAKDLYNFLSGMFFKDINFVCLDIFVKVEV